MIYFAVNSTWTWKKIHLTRKKNHFRRYFIRVYKKWAQFFAHLILLHRKKEKNFRYITRYLQTFDSLFCTNSSSSFSKRIRFLHPNINIEILLKKTEKNISFLSIVILNRNSNSLFFICLSKKVRLRIEKKLTWPQLCVYFATNLVEQKI